MKRLISILSFVPAVVFAQSFPPRNAAVSTWMMHHGATSLSGLQLLKGAVNGPNIKCSGSFSTGSEGDPAVADINNDGLNEVVILTYSSPTVYAFRGTDCSLLWTRSLGASSTGWGTPAIGELDPTRPGLEIVVGHRGGTIYALSGTDGSIIWSQSVGVYYSPATVADVDGDGYGEVYITGNSTIYALRGTDGGVIWTYPAGSNYGNIAIGDINNDSQDEAIVVAGGNLLVLRATNGTLLWSYSGGGQGNPVLADLDNDGFLEIVMTTGSGNVYAFRYDGTLYWNWNSGCSSYWGSLNSPTAGDINGDGMIEILFGCHPSGGYVYALRGTDGSTIWSYSGTKSGYQALSRKMGDIDNDGRIEVIVSGARYGSSPHLVILRGTDGSVKWTYDADYFEGLSIADVDNDGCMELVSNCDFASSTFYIFDSSVPVSDCGVLGYDDPISVGERKSSGLYLSVMGSKGGVVVETGKEAYVEVYNTSGRKVKDIRVSGKTFVRLKSGVYVFKVKGWPIYKAVVVKE